ncbi:MAG: hypothetical protein QOE05_2753 [Actinomycetota bacterium]|nr:hypothetical protein [Actinomycetota bacterium]
MSLGDVLGLLGLAVAIYQLWRTGRLVTATKRSVDRTSRQLGIYTLLLLIPELALIELELERAAMAQNRQETGRLLREWQHRASELRGLLATEPVDDGGLGIRVQASLTLATQAKVALQKGRDPGTATARLRASVEAVCLEARTLGATIRAASPASDEEVTVWDDFLMLYGKLRSVDKTQTQQRGLGATSSRPALAVQVSQPASPAKAGSSPAAVRAVNAVPQAPQQVASDHPNLPETQVSNEAAEEES